ncbi:ParB N-terminal domain-containing protein [Variovorax sp. YR216]|uniref:ParB N-terminal domain-containing protein n=1 Tax=Variovorax sp. YR216 TaxID=1882828 RepID=UPI0035248CCC
MIPATSELSRTGLQTSGRWRLESNQSTDIGEEWPRRDEVALVDPANVTVHRFHGRHASALESDALQEFKASILRRGGNVLPVLLFKGNGGQLELIFGRRRLRAAYELGIPVTAVIQEWRSDVEAVRAMAVESRGGDLPWSVFERGTMLKGCLEGGLYPSIRRAAEDLGWSLSEVNQALAAAELPPELIAAFRTPSDLAGEWVLPLAEALGRTPLAVLATARGFATGAKSGSPRTRYLDLKRSAVRV